MKHKLPYKTPAEKREYDITMTAGIIKRDIGTTRKLVANWPTVKIKRRLSHAVWHCMSSVPPPAVKWWAARKRGLQLNVVDT